MDLLASVIPVIHIQRLSEMKFQSTSDLVKMALLAVAF